MDRRRGYTLPELVFTMAIAIGLLGGRSYPSDPSIRGMWLGHSWFHRKEHFYRALLESFAYEYAYDVPPLDVVARFTAILMCEPWLS